MERNLNEQGLYRLRNLTDYEVSKSDPDVRGWNVISSDNKNIGTVDELIVNPDEMKVRYLDIYLDKDIQKENENRHLLIPIGAAELNEKRKAVNITTIETVTLLKIPEYQGGNVTRDYEKHIRRTIKPNEPIPETEADFYNDDLFDDNRFYRSRSNKLFKLKEIDPENILRGKPDVRGWKAAASDGVEIGVVDELLVDKENNKIRYLDIRLTKGSVFNETHHVLIPVGLASIGINKDEIVLTINSSEVINIPSYNGSVITREYESSILDSLKNENEENNFSNEDEFYDQRNYNDKDFFSRQK